MVRTAIITGGSKGIGWELVQLFAHSGYHVLSGSRTITEKIPSDIRENVRQVESIQKLGTIIKSWLILQSHGRAKLMST